MDFYIVIPAHNEQDTIGLTLESISNQTLLPKKLVVVNDNSTDNTLDVVSKYVSKHEWISVISVQSSNDHIPGSKVINAFYKGFETLDNNYDVICKFDADIILPNNYLESITTLFKNDNAIGIAGGLLYIEKNNKWIYENIADKTHVRGPIKAYQKGCFDAIGGLRTSIGWDTVDTLLAKFYDWKIITDKSLQVKHLKPTGFSYNNNSSKYLQGEAMYKMRYGFLITLIAALKLAFNKKKPSLLRNYIAGYLKAKKNKLEFLVTEAQGQFIRKLRWKGILGKLL